MFLPCRLLIVSFVLIALSEPFAHVIASARVGSGRSNSGRSRGSPFSAPRSAPQQPAPFAQPRQPQSPQAQIPPQAPASGGFMRNMMGGVAGGFLGSMLFGSLTGNAGNGGGSGGIGGLLPLILLAGGAYFAYRFWSKRKLATAMNSQYAQAPASFGQDIPSTVLSHSPPELGGPSREQATDLFFRIQGAWTKRNLASVSDILEPSLARVIAQDLEDLKAKRQLNKLENISIRDVIVGQGFMDGGQLFSVVRYRASLLDFTLDEDSMAVVSGSDCVPVKFEEDWTFQQSGHTWILSGIQQILL